MGYVDTEHRSLSQVVTHSVDFLHIGEHHFGINSIVLNHSHHVVSCQKVWYARKSSENINIEHFDQNFL